MLVASFVEVAFFPFAPESSIHPSRMGESITVSMFIDTNCSLDVIWT
jgi:hypothetical protein